MKKDRKYTRRHTSDYFLVKSVQANEIIGRAVNLSLGGLMVIGNKNVAVNGILDLQLMFPRTFANRPGISFTAEIRWSKYNNHADWWEVGFEILKIEPGDLITLHQVLKELDIAAGERRDAAATSQNISSGVKLEYIKTR